MSSPSAAEFDALVRDARAATPKAVLAVPLCQRLLADQLTPVVAYRRLVSGDERTAASFLLESVEGGERQGRHSILGAQPIGEVVARGQQSTWRWRGQFEPEPDAQGISVHTESAIEHDPGTDPLAVLRQSLREMRLVMPPARGPREALPACVLGGWFGYASYDSVRYAEPEKLPFSAAPRDDRALPDVHFSFYDGVVVFDHVDKLVHVVQLALVSRHDDPAQVRRDALAKLARRVEQLSTHSRPLPLGVMPPDTPARPLPSNMTRAQHAAMLARAQEYIKAGDIFQVVLGQRFERTSPADPFDVYRALRAVNPSPYMVYMQCPTAGDDPDRAEHGCILVASSPEILCRVRKEGTKASRHQGTKPDGTSASHAPTSTLDASMPACPDAFVLTNRPLAGTRRRGATPEEDRALERELLADPKERAEHIMLVDLGRNDVGRVCVPGSIELPRVMEVERYSHVMHISSTVTGTLRPGLDCWDALRATLPVGTISGAPKIRAMQIIDELEPLRRGPYGGGMGYVGLDGQMDIALALRTMVVPLAARTGTLWTYHLQAAGGIVADSQPEPEYMETVNKAAALARAIDVAEAAFAAPGPA